MSPTSGTLISISDMELVSSAHAALRWKDARALIEIGGELERRGIFHLAWRYWEMVLKFGSRLCCLFGLDQPLPEKCFS